MFGAVAVAEDQGKGHGNDQRIGRKDEPRGGPSARDALACHEVAALPVAIVRDDLAAIQVPTEAPMPFVISMKRPWALACMGFEASCSTKSAPETLKKSKATP